MSYALAKVEQRSEIFWRIPEWTSAQSGSIVLGDGLRVVTANAEEKRENGGQMPIFYSPQTGICANCDQHWTVSFPAFDVYCPQCHALVRRIGGFDRISGARE